MKAIERRNETNIKQDTTQESKMKPIPNVSKTSIKRNNEVK
jgi:hypothetical protein